MDCMTIRGVIPPLPTPLSEDSRRIDSEGLEKLVEGCLEAGVGGLLLLGTCGEGPLATRELREELIGGAARLVNGKVPILVGAGGLRWEDVIAQLKQAADLGASCGLVLPPLYYRLAREAIVQYFRGVADVSPLPIILYNIPHLAGNGASVDMVSQLADHPNIIGIKDSSGDFTFFQNVLAETRGKEFSVFQGKAEYILPSLLEGAAGSMTFLASISPHTELALHRAVAAGDLSMAARLQLQVTTFANAFSRCGHPLPSLVKGILCHLGVLTEPGVLLPGVKVPRLESPDLAEVATTLAELLRAGKEVPR